MASEPSSAREVGKRMSRTSSPVITALAGSPGSPWSAGRDGLADGIGVPLVCRSVRLLTGRLQDLRAHVAGSQILITTGTALAAELAGVGLGHDRGTGIDLRRDG